MTALDLFTAALRVTGSLGTGEVPSADDAFVVMQAFNLMLDQMATERSNLFTDTLDVYNLTPNQQGYTIGPGAGNFAGIRPVCIREANIIIPGTTGRKAMSILGAAGWMSLGERGLTGVFPDKLYCDYNFPIAKLYIHPIPSGVIQLEIAAWGQLTQVVGLTDILNFPPGYLEELKYNLAMKISPEFGMPPDQMVIAQAVADKAAIRQINEELMANEIGQAQAFSSPTAGNPPQGQAA